MKQQCYTYTIRTSRRDDLMRHLSGQDIETRINYQPPVHLMRGYEFLGYRNGALPVTERLFAQSLSLPLFPELSFTDVDIVTEAIRTFFRQVNSDEYRNMFTAEDSHWWYQSVHGLVLGIIEKEYSQKGPLNIFDAGCGTGRLSELMAGHGTASGCDMSETALAY